MSNKELYKKTFANVTTSAALELEDVMKNNTGRPLRMRRSLLLVSLMLVLLMAMSAISFAATDGKIIDYVQVLINGESVNFGEHTVKGEDGKNYKLNIYEDSESEEGEESVNIDIKEE